MADKRISQLVERVTVANNDVVPIVASGASTTNKATISSIQTFMQGNLDLGVTSVGITLGTTGTNINVTGSPVTSSGNITINIPTASATNRGALSSADWSTFNGKVSSVGLTMPSAFTVANSPITSSGTIAVTGAGTVGQYVRGDGSLADFPQGGGGGGASVSYYLNLSVSQGSIGGIAYSQMSRVPVFGAGTDTAIASNGYIASFITDAGDPALLQIPGGNWNFETFFSANSNAGSPKFYIELYKVNSGGTATLIASNSATPEDISFGTTIHAYFSALAVPTTTLTLTDRLALRFYVLNSGRTITLHTENSHLCQVITTFTTGLTALNGLTEQVQNFATGTSGTDFAISSASTTHTFNLPDASATARGVVTTGTQTFAGYKIFTGTIGANVDIQLATQGTALNTFLKNINAAGQTSIGSNGFGFNNSNNIYFSGSSKGGGIFAFSNTGNQTYTLQDASGTLAFTSQIPANIVTDGGVGTADRVPKFTGPGVLTNSAISDATNEVNITKRIVSTVSTHQIVITPSLGGVSNRIETTNLPLELVTTGSAIRLAAGGATPQITLNSNGTTDFVTSTSSFATMNSTDANGGVLSFRRNGTNVGHIGNSAQLGGGVLDAIEVRSGTGSSVILKTDGGQLTLTTSGTVGIGTATPATYSGWGGLDVRGTNGGHVIVANTGGTNRGEIFTDSNGFNVSAQTNNALLLKTNDTTRLTIAATGAATFSSSVTAASFAASGQISTGNGADADILINVSASGAATKFASIQSSVSARNLVLNPTNGGNVGIGTASPAGKFEIASAANTYTGAPAITLTDTAGDANSNRWIVGNIATDYGSFNIASAPSPSSITYTPRLTINRSGNVGIGTASPATALDVRGASSATIRVGSTGNGGSGDEFGNLEFYWGDPDAAEVKAKIYAKNVGNVGPGGGGAADLLFATTPAFGSSTERMRITSGGVLQMSNNSTTFSIGSIAGQNRIQYGTGGFTTEFAFINSADNYTPIGASAFNTRSDYRLKEDLQDFNALDLIKNIKVYDFKWKENEERNYGFMAHELQEVVPYVVSGTKDGMFEDEPQFQGMDASKLVPILFKAIQEQQVQIDSLKNQIK